jgi:hypothetical protein
MSNRTIATPCCDQPMGEDEWEENIEYGSCSICDEVIES